MSPVPRAVLFDLDGTLIDSYPAIAASVNYIRALRGLPPLSVAEVTPHVGRGPSHLLRSTIGVGEDGDNIAAYRDHHPTVMRSLTTLLPGAAEVLRALRESGRKVGICSNKPIAFTRELVLHLHIADWLDVALGPEDAGKHKPAPDILWCALARLGVPPEEALYIGDMTVDIETARAAGVPVWVVPTGSDTSQALEAAQPDRLLTSLADIVPSLNL